MSAGGYPGVSYVVTGGSGGIDKADNLHVPGAKETTGKPMVGLVLGDFAGALLEVARVGTFGASKYTPHGWVEVPDGIGKYTDAMMRHWLYEKMGHDLDNESGLLHAAHLAWNALARLELMLRTEPESW